MEIGGIAYVDPWPTFAYPYHLPVLSIANIFPRMASWIREKCSLVSVNTIFIF